MIGGIYFPEAWVMHELDTAYAGLHFFFFSYCLFETSFDVDTVNWVSLEVTNETIDSQVPLTSLGICDRERGTSKVQ